MKTIGFEIADVVDEVDDAGQHTEDPERAEHANEGVRIEQLLLLAEDQTGKDDDVLRPLFRPEREQQIGQKRATAWSNSLTTPAVLDYEKLLSASCSTSNVSNTVKSFVMLKRSVMRLVRFTSLSWPP